MTKFTIGDVVQITEKGWVGTITYVDWLNKCYRVRITNVLHLDFQEEQLSIFKM